jgi:hypothetical protein
MNSRTTRYQGNFNPGFYKILHQGINEKKIEKCIVKKKKTRKPNSEFKELMGAINYNIANMLKVHGKTSPVRTFQLYISTKTVEIFQELGLNLNNRFKPPSNDFLENYKIITSRFFNAHDYSEIAENSFKMKISTKKPLLLLNRDLIEEQLKYPSKLCCKFTVKNRVNLI